MHNIYYNMQLIIEFSNSYDKLIEPFIEYSDNLDDIYSKIKFNLNIDLNKFNCDIIKRNTVKGFKMTYHRDNYLIRKINGKNIFVPYDKINLSKYSLLWYKNDEFTGGTLEFITGSVIKPEKNMFIFFDSNDIHKVNIQTNGIRIVELYKFY